MLLGVNAADNTPVLVPRSIFAEHAHLLGDSGSGKTSLGIALILSQMLRFKDCSIVVIDMKGDDMALFEGTRTDAQRAGLPFRWFTNELGRSTHAFNPLGQSFFSTLSVYQKTDILTSSMGLQYGTDYGRGFFSDANAELLFHALKAAPDTDSFQQLQQVLGNRYALRTVSNETLKAATHIRAVVHRLAATQALNVSHSGDYPPAVLEQAIDFADVFRKPQVIYFHLPSSLGTTSSAEIARIALYALLASARSVPDNQRRQVFLFIDEFQRVVANNLELILQTARSMKIGLILANQSMFDLRRGGVDLIPAVRANTRYRQIFAASNVEDQKELIALSGEMLVDKRTWLETLSGWYIGAVGVNHHEEIRPRLGVNDVLLATDHPFQSILQIRRGEGYAQYGGFPFVMRSTHHIGWNEYLRRKNAAWPEPTGATIVAQEVTDQPETPVLAPINQPPVVLASTPATQPVGPDPLLAMWQEQVGKRKQRTLPESSSNT